MGKRRTAPPQIDFNKALGLGRESATTSTDICRRYGIGRRDLVEQVQKARKKGVAIAAAMDEPMGYYRPETPDEMRDYIATLDSRINELQKVRDASAATLLDDLKKGI